MDFSWWPSISLSDKQRRPVPVLHQGRLLSPAEVNLRKENVSTVSGCWAGLGWAGLGLTRSWLIFYISCSETSQGAGSGESLGECSVGSEDDRSLMVLGETLDREQATTLQHYSLPAELGRLWHNTSLECESYWQRFPESYLLQNLYVVWCDAFGFVLMEK